MTTPDIRALLQELTDAVLSDDSHIDCAEIARRARAALAEPEPPDAGEVAELVGFLNGLANSLILPTELNDQLHSAADLLSRQTPQPVPEGPSDEELRDLWHGSDWFNEGATLREFRSIARAVLARWGAPHV